MADQRKGPLLILDKQTKYWFIFELPTSDLNIISDIKIIESRVSAEDLSNSTIPETIIG